MRLTHTQKLTHELRVINFMQLKNFLICILDIEFLIREKIYHKTK